MFFKTKTSKSTNDSLLRARAAIDHADAIVIGAGAGLSLAAGFTLNGERFDKYFSDFKEHYGISDMYSGGFYHFDEPTEYWAWWSRCIWLNRYQAAPKDTYGRLRRLVANHDYFVLTTNVDHQFQEAGFDRQRLFYTQGDYGLFQKESEQKTYDNYELIREMILSQGFDISPSHELVIKKSRPLKMRVDRKLADAATDFELNLRVDNHFVEDKGWHRAARRFNDFIDQHRAGQVVYLELGVGENTPAIIKYPFWMWVYKNPAATYVDVNSDQVYYPEQIQRRAIGLKIDINDFVSAMVSFKP